MTKEIIIKDEKLLLELEKYTTIEKCTLEELVIKILNVFLEAQKKNTNEDYLKKYEKDRQERKRKLEKMISNM